MSATASVLNVQPPKLIASVITSRYTIRRANVFMSDFQRAFAAVRNRWIARTQDPAGGMSCLNNFFIAPRRERGSLDADTAAPVLPQAHSLTKILQVSCKQPVFIR